MEESADFCSDESRSCTNISRLPVAEPNTQPSITKPSRKRDRSPLLMREKSLLTIAIVGLLRKRHAISPNSLRSIPKCTSSSLSRNLVEIPGGYRVDDASGNRLGYFYSWDDPSGRHHADVLTGDEARRMAEAFATLPQRDRPPSTVPLDRPNHGGGDSDSGE